MGKLSKFKNFIIETIKSRDIYGRTITFTFHGEDQYKTFIGGCSTVVLVTFSLIYFIILMTQLASNKFVTSTINTNFVDLDNEDKISIGDTEFTFAFKIDGVTYDQLTDPTYFNVKIIQTIYTTDDDGNIIDDTISYIETEIWEDVQSGLDDYIKDDPIIGKFLCPKTTDSLYLDGLYGLSNSIRYFSLFIRFWDQTDFASWADLADIKALADRTTFELKMVNSYFDSDDYDKPVKTYIDSTIYNYVNFGYSKESDIYLQYNTAETEDSKFSILGSTTEHNYLSVDKIHQYFDVDPNNENDFLISINFFLSNKRETTTRSTLSIFDVLGIAGGFASILTMFFGVFINYISDAMYNYNLNWELYQVDASGFEVKSEIDQFGATPSNQPSRISPQGNNELIKVQQVMNDSLYPDDDLDFSTKSAVKLSYEGKETSEEAKAKRVESIKSSFESMSFRRQYNYTCRDLCYNLCCCIKKKPKNKMTQNNWYDRYQLYTKGTNNIMLEFDAINFAKSQRRLKMLLDSLMDENERVLAEFQVFNTIKGTPSSNLMKSVPNVPKLMTKDTKSIEKYRLSIKEFFDRYTNEVLTRKDFKLLNNIWDQNPISEIELDKMEVAGDGFEHLNKQPSRRNKELPLIDKGENPSKIVKEFEHPELSHTSSMVNKG